MSGDSARPEYGETWVYESIIGALPGIRLPTWAAMAIQLLIFEVAIVALSWYYEVWSAAIAGTVVVFVATIGSAEMLRISTLIRRIDVPPTYRALLFASNVEVVLSVLAYVALLTHLFVFDPQVSSTPLLGQLFGSEPPVLVVYLTLLILWDVSYRIGTGWWASVTGLWRSARYRFDPETARVFIRADLEIWGFGVLQLVLVPFVLDQPVLLAALVGHVIAVTAVTAASVGLLRYRSRTAAVSQS
ncbi:hypothetical protein HISP_00885 [Haloarcula hispanica N601]|uniref:Uncharacterized protein n=3 Tax=Haloarcula hispanica TaxID=51589 RepID=A0A482TD77_HALHI|nr:MULTISPECIES: hypothetical protein [Haloarcula]AEM55794.1 conserved hypothetical protein [Haloarcula hispanica ATCC 33960]AHB64622.1 hypothetical protein HISP_00885 [Haloarcula hispanica N601]AJF25810.1 hypothetical protein SG26_08745 [Haloarcula sp. CBA1115]KAA9405554.1 hypothetical protein Har1131_01550 [Haloarcula sp. CBA1131]KAA9408563.1 hypothetical protein EGO51_01750 [Haloarcula hispanica]